MSLVTKLCSLLVLISLSLSLPRRVSLKTVPIASSSPLRSASGLDMAGLEPPESVLSDSLRQVGGLDDEYDYVVIGSGIGGLSSAAMLSKIYGFKVLVLESHYLPGGCAHTFERKGFKFDAGPSLWNGMATKPLNPLGEILELIGEADSIDYAHYDGWVMHTPDCSFKFTVGEGEFEKIIKQHAGPNALTEWNELLEVLKPIQELSVAIPPLVLRSDVGLILTLLPHMPKLLKGALVASKVEGPFKHVSEKVIKDKFLENWFEFLSFALSGLPADGTIAAAVAYTMRDLHQKGAKLDYPIGGSAAVVEALVRGMSNGNEESKILYNSHVTRINFDNNGKASGVSFVTKNKEKSVKAKRAVISNASMWDTVRLLPDDVLSSSSSNGNNIDSSTASKVQSQISSTRAKVDVTPMTNSFVHLHIGINATGLPADLESHYSVINTWSDIEEDQNHVIISIPSVLDPGMAPEGCHVIHAYAAANEPWDLYDDYDSNDGTSPGPSNKSKKGDKESYQELKNKRCDFLWKAIERSIPDVRERVIVDLEGSPLTHQRFNRRYKGTYGPALRAGKEKFPYPKDLNIEGLLNCGDSVFPGIGVPAVAASGANAASSSVSVFEQLKMLEQLYDIAEY